MTGEALFEDRHTDATMRRTIPRFARLGAVIVAATAPFAASSTTGRLVLLGLAAVAVLVASAVTWRNLIDRASRDAVFALLVVYCALIALAVAATDDPNSPYRYLYAIPVVYAAVFFTGWERYALAAAAPLLDYVVVGSFVRLSARDEAIRLLLFLLLAHFGTAVSDILREALRANRSLHTVLEAASGDPLEADLAAIGVDAALFVAGWDAAAVALVDEGRITFPATRGVTEPALAQYDTDALEPDQTVLVASVLSSGEMLQIEDLTGSVAEDHPFRLEGLVSVAAIPITYRGSILGALLVGHRRRRSLDLRERDRLQRVAEQLGLALGSAMAYRRETEVADNLRELNRRKDEFLANVSHELRTPAATIKLVASMLARSADQLAPAQLQEMYATLERRSAHLTELIGDLLDEALAEAGGLRLAVGTIEWNEAVAAWAERATLQTERPVQVTVPDKRISGAGDAVKLERVVSNLLTNAAKFSPPESPIELALDEDGADGDIVVTVRDYGIGIDDDDQERIFERFHQVDGGTTRTAGGFGLGLSLARHFAESHGGSLQVSSTPGDGSTFTLRVPRTPPVPASRPAPPSRPARSTGVAGQSVTPG